ncbi:MAG: peptidylprolyl isomerase [Myxococcota bacterium]|jgi:FKBP-type peptidyl-prolyl cis-trans isomerase SlyD|nr:peptidylprolyl isomerase [Myxococcota bacterium]
MTTEAIQENKVVAIHYTLTSSDGEELDSSAGGPPLYYLHGHQNIVPGLENQLTGKNVGDKVTAVVPPEEGYGLPSGAPAQPIERSAFPPGTEIEEGMAFFAQGPGGQPLQVFVTGVTDAEVFITTDHPLAGVTLNFDVEVVEIRDASDEELAHGHVHGPGGHHH